MNDLKKIIENMDPEQAMADMADAIRQIFPHVSEKFRMDVMLALTRDADKDSVPNLVHL